MRISRRLILGASLLAACTTALAQDYPAKPIRFIVPFPPGGGTDSLTRLVANKLTETLKWNFVVENKPGAGGNVALDTTAKAAPDGYTLVMAQTDNVVLNPLLYSKLTYDPVKDLVPVGLVASGPAVLVVRADSPYKTLADVVAAAKAAPAKLTFASPGLGTVSHLISELWQKSSGMKLTHVPYRGLSQALPDVLSGQVDMYMGSIPTLQGHIKGGKVRALAVTTAKRSPVLPQVPTYTESGIPGVELASVWGVMAPSGTPQNVIQRLNTELNKVLQQPDTREKIIASGAVMLGGSPQEMGELYAADRQKLAPVVRDSGTRLD
ncbi:Bug family tripartite tricarboxylate transporter substrate binding protein [Alicycliphilus denitrificans]|uniref:Tripartite tricarboxylate transporter substrate binding protein n=1 Tax=Alicycliphilus denitrificans TaxID=179636 RepID=A0A3R7H2I8_9BURK|nr:tripartite tricarboxylate transporter substrate binding protein [Alicycliphilus denitrificans]RKJ97295.1 tripartite tricarboxylate transporter substrate binding protein [Alicycliphilus denitrificans]